MRCLQVFALLLIVAILSGCGDHIWNNPYPYKERLSQIFYTAFTSRPKHLDPAIAYSSDEYAILGQVYEPPLQYHYLKRPYTLIPQTLTAMPQVHYYDAKLQRLPDNALPEQVAFSVYRMNILPGILYQPHPALAQLDDGSYRYHKLQASDLDGIHTLNDFPITGTRELLAQDYVHQIKRLADPTNSSPILGLMETYIVGLGDLAEQLAKQLRDRQANGEHTVSFDLRNYTMTGARVVDDHTYEVVIHGKDPQFMYWLAMPFLSPMPWEADVFYHQPGMAERNIVSDWYPIGTGPYMLTVNNPNRKMVLQKNPNFHEELYPSEGEPGDAERGLLADAGKVLPFIDEVVFVLEKETIPRWNKFLQGYYDRSGIATDNFDQAIKSQAGDGESELTQEMQKKGITLETDVNTSTVYWAFNMLDPVVGGYTEQARKLRQAIGIAIDTEEDISIFANGRAIPAQGPIPPGIFGYEPPEQNFNHYMYEKKDGHIQRLNISRAKQLLAEAGYPGGRDVVTGAPLELNYDVASSGGPDDQAIFSWFVKQLKKIDVGVNVRATQYNRFRDKVDTGNAQIFSWGWNADYPDPENFLFLFYGKNSKVQNGGENTANYQNSDFDRMYEIMRDMDNTPIRESLIRQMVEILRRDSPWVWGFHPKSYTLSHSWVGVSKNNEVAQNTFKYQHLNPTMRAELRNKWNKPILWPLFILLLLLIAGTLPVISSYRAKEQQPPDRTL